MNRFNHCLSKIQSDLSYPAISGPAHKSDLAGYEDMLIKQQCSRVKYISYVLLIATLFDILSF